MAVVVALSSHSVISAAEPAAPPIDWKKMMTIAEVKRDKDGNLLPLQSYDETIRRGMSFLLDDHLKWFKGPAESLLDEKGQTQMPWVFYSNLQQNGAPFPNSVDRFVSYPAFHHALMIRTLIDYGRYTGDKRSLAEAVKLADWEIAHSTPADLPYGSLPWSTYEAKKPGGFRDKTGLMPDKAAIMALAYIQLHEATGEMRFLNAAEAIAKTLAARQRENGTWPFRVDPKTEQVIEEYTSSVIYAIQLFESLDKLNGNDRYRTNRDKTWNWLLNGPIKTKEFRGFYEDIVPSKDGRTNYDCLDTIRYLLANRTDSNGYLEMAKDLNAWVEKIFLDKIKGFEPAEGIREQLQCNVVMGIHSLNWASMLLELAEATGDEKLKQRAEQTANYITYYLQPDNRIVVGFQYNQWWYSCHAGVVLYLLDFVGKGKVGQAKIEISNTRLGVVLGTNSNPTEKRLTELLAECFKDRAGINLAEEAEKAPLRLIIGTTESNEKIKDFAANHKEVAELGADGYMIAFEAEKSELYIAGQSNSGVVAGLGRLMREMRFEQGKVVVPTLQISETPQMPNRGMYLWARKYYFNQPDQVDRYIEEFALWGGNALCFWFEMGMFENLQDTTGEKSELNSGYARQYKLDKSSAKDWITMYQRFYATARRMGMKTGLLMVANDAYMSSPKELRIKPIIGCPDWYLCPSKPEAVQKMVTWQEEVFKALSPLDIYNIFPADPGGCACDECKPWPTRGFWNVARPLAERIHEISPKTEIWIDTWHLNHPTFGGKDWKNLVDSLDWSKERPEWFAGFEVGLAPNHGYARMSAEERDYYNKAKQPLMVFPDISMWGNHPGMLVNKEYWKTLQDELNSYDPELMKGGWPYAERWNTDIASVMFLSWFTNPKKSVETVLDEYASFYFGAEAANVRQLLELLDDSNKDPQRKEKIRKTQAELEASLPAWAKSDWRWTEIVESCKYKTR